MSAIRSSSPDKAALRLSAAAHGLAPPSHRTPAPGFSALNTSAPTRRLRLPAALAADSPASSDYATCVDSPLTCVTTATPLQPDPDAWSSAQLSPLEGMLSFDNPSFDHDSELNV